MPVSQKKVSQGRNKTLQAKLSDFKRPSASKKSSASMEGMDSEASSTPEDKSPDKSKDTVAGEPGPMSAAFLTAISDMKTVFHQV